MANLGEYVEANMKRMMRINDVCEYNETFEYEANLIHIRFEANKKLVNTAHPNQRESAKVPR